MPSGGGESELHRDVESYMEKESNAVLNHCYKTDIAPKLDSSQKCRIRHKNQRSVCVTFIVI